MLKFLNQYGEMLAQEVVTHLFYVLVSVFIGGLVAILFGIGLSRRPQWAKWLIPLLSIFQTIPGLVFIGVLFIYIGIQPATVIVALGVYAFFPIMKNTYTGLVSVDPSLMEAAKGSGMTTFQTLRYVELPMAANAIFSGIRLATIYTVSWAILAAMIGLGGLGTFVYQGIATNNQALIIGGAIPSAILALLLGYGLDWLQYRLTPRGMRGDDIRANH